jgi:hypothetical protein
MVPRRLAIVHRAMMSDDTPIDTGFAIRTRGAELIQDFGW